MDGIVLFVNLLDKCNCKGGPTFKCNFKFEYKYSYALTLACMSFILFWLSLAISALAFVLTTSKLKVACYL